MSGPKVSEYELTRAQRAMLAEIRRQREMELAAERQRLRQVAEKHRDLLSSAAKLKEKAASIGAKAASLSPIITEYARISGDTKLKDEQQSVLQATDSLSAVLTSITDSLTNEQIESVLQGASQKAGEIQKQEEALDKLVEDTRQRFQAELDESVASLFSAISREEGDEEPSEASQVLWAREEIASYSKIEHLPMTLRTRLEQVGEKLEEQERRGTLENYIAIELQPVFRECEEARDLWQRLGPVYEELSDTYHAMLNEAGVPEEKEIPFHAGAIAELNNAISKLQAKIQEEDEQRYIIQALNEVMDEMGYNLWGEREVRKRSGTHFQNKLYRFSEETAISVTYHDNGQVAMELGKVDTCDRAPGENESIDMESQMVTFCDRFREIEQKLLDRGVVLRDRIALTPPSQEYAQIININDFERQELAFREKRAQAKQDIRYMKDEAR